MFIIGHVSSGHVSSGNVISSLVSVATCRAACLSQVTGADTEQCWSMCHHVSQHPDTCDHPDCGHVCSVTCHHYSFSNQTPVMRRTGHNPVTTRFQFLRMPKISGCSMSWSPLTPVSNSMTRSSESDAGTVYLVLGQDRAGQWYELSQSVSTWSTLAPSITMKLARMVIMGVRRDGVHDSIIIDTKALECHQEENSVRRPAAVQRRVDTDLTPVYTVTNTDSPLLAELSLQWSGVVSDQSPRYLVQWTRLPEGVDIVGNLVTGDTGVTLTLERDQHYVVSVQDISSGAVSAPLIVSTHSSADQSSVTVLIILVIVFIIIISIICCFIIRNKIISRQTLEDKQNHFNNQFEKTTVDTKSDDITVKHRLESLVGNIVHHVKQYLKRDPVISLESQV